MGLPPVRRPGPEAGAAETSAPRLSGPVGEASPRPWRVTNFGLTVVDANGERVALMDGGSAPREEADAALIVAAVNAVWEQELIGRADARLAEAARALRPMPCARVVSGQPVTHCVLPAGHTGPCVPERSEPPAVEECKACEHAMSAHARPESVLPTGGCLGFSDWCVHCAVCNPQLHPAQRGPLASGVRSALDPETRCSHGDHAKCVRGGCQHCGITACYRFVSAAEVAANPEFDGARVADMLPPTPSCRLGGRPPHTPECECGRLA